MALPVILIALATLAASVVAYGTQPLWAQFPHGLQFIVLSRQLQWPLISLAMLLCLTLLAQVASGRKRAWWLIGLGPVLALFGHRFGPGHHGSFGAVVENPPFVAADQAKGLADDDYVVGLSFAGNDYAYPYATLYSSPVVIQADREKRMMLMWSAYANRAVAVTVARDVRARDLEVVSTPANALLLYDCRVGQFMNGLKGQTMTGQKPPGFGAPIPTTKMMWSTWRSTHHATRVMVAMAPPRPNAPSHPIPPSCPMPPTALVGTPDRRVTLVGTTRPVAVTSDDVGRSPLNLTADACPILIFRDSQQCRHAPSTADWGICGRGSASTTPASTPEQHFSMGTPIRDGMPMAPDGRAKQFKGKKLAPVVVDDDLYWGVMKFWYPELELSVDPGPAPTLAGAADYIGVRKPIARTTHHPARASKTANAPPPSTNAVTAHRHAEPAGSAQNQSSASPMSTRTMP